MGCCAPPRRASPTCAVVHSGRLCLLPHQTLPVAKSSRLAASTLETFELVAHCAECEQRPKPSNRAVQVVLGDPDRLRGILLNLYTNAAKFTRRGAIALRVSVAGPDYRCNLSLLCLCWRSKHVLAF